MRVAVLGVALGVGWYSVFRFGQHMAIGGLTADWPWLYRTGLYILSEHALPRTDLYSWTFPDHPWLLYQWLFEVLAAALYRPLGTTASVAFFTLLALGIYVVVPALVLRRRGVPAALTVLVGAGVLFPVTANLSLRPMLATTLALLAQFLLVSRWRARRMTTIGLLCLLAPGYVLWANMHLGITLGFGSLVLFALGDAIERGFRPADPVPTRGWLAYGALGLAGFAASLLNPYGLGIYPYIVDLSLERRMNARIHELMPPDPTNTLFVVGELLLAGLVLHLLFARRHYRIGDLLHVLVFAGMTMLALRFVVWAGLFYVLVVPAAFWNHVESGAGLRAAASWCVSAQRRVDIGFILLFAFVSSVLVGWAVPITRPVQISSCNSLRGAIVWLDAHYRPGVRWFSSEIAGSCTRLYAPERRVFVDTRFDMFPPGFVLRWLDAYQAQPGWQAFLARWHIQLLLLPRNSPLVDHVSRNAKYRPIYADGGALIFTRQPNAGHAP